MHVNYYVNDNLISLQFRYEIQPLKSKNTTMYYKQFAVDKCQIYWRVHGRLSLFPLRYTPNGRDYVFKFYYRVDRTKTNNSSRYTSIP